MSDSAFYVPDGGTVNSLFDLMQRIRALSGEDYLGRIYLRGQTDFTWGLKPTIGRMYCFSGKRIEQFSPMQERNFLHRFRRRAYSYYNRYINEWEALLLARHHGLPVRLLDWTTNPLVGLYNACIFEAEAENDGAVWAFRPSKQSQDDYIDVFTEVRSPLKIPGVKIIWPFDASPRMTVQSSIFTIQEDPFKELQDYHPEDFLKEDFDIEKMIRWRVPRKNKTNIIEDLDRNGINVRTLFPDLDGLARGILQTEIVHYGSAIMK